MSYWDHRRPTRRARAVGIIDVARISAELLDRGGLRALTVRAVAERLAVAPASLYSRVDSVEDLFDLALDHALGADSDLCVALARSDLHGLLLAYFRHLSAHPWTCQVIAMRAPRGPNYLKLSERMIELLANDGVFDPLSTAYALSNFVIGSASTASIATGERSSSVDPAVAPMYAQLHRGHTADTEAIVAAGLAALMAGLRSRRRP